MERLLRERRNITTGKEDDFSVRDMKQIAQTQTATTTVLTGLLAAVAGVSLLVGGIGIMNIMLVSVTERTREIGIRLAIGALEGQVLMQFLVEAVVLSGLGGLVGIMLGLGLAGLATRALEVPFVLDPTIVLIAVRLLGHRRRRLRLLPGAPRGALGPHRGASPRVNANPDAGSPKPVRSFQINVARGVDTKLRDHISPSSVGRICLKPAPCAPVQHIE